MLKAKSKIKMNFQKISKLTKASVTALEMTAEALHTEVLQAQVIPFDTGNLEGESFYVDYAECKNGTASLAFDTPYARKLYYHPEYDFSTLDNVNAKGNWLEDWQENGAKADFAPKTFKRFYKKVGGV